MNFQDCYKVLIETLCNFGSSSNTEGFFDQCIDSNDENVELYTYTPIEDQKDHYWAGGGEAGGKGCYSLKLGTLQNQILSRIIMSLAENSKKNQNVK